MTTTQASSAAILGIDTKLLRKIAMQPIDCVPKQPFASAMRSLPIRSQHPGARGVVKAPVGFTLIEILVVVVIIGILGAVIVPNLLSRPDQARITAAETDLRQLSNALDMYRLDNFHYPSTEQGLEALVSRPAGFPEPKNWNPDGYVKSLPSDPWGSPYVYERRSSDFTIFSLGADGVEGGEGTNADVTLNAQ